MRFKTEENLPLEAATTLRDAGFDVETVSDEALSGAADEIVATRVQEESRVLITLDLDFANRRHPFKDPGQSDCGGVCPQVNGGSTASKSIRRVVDCSAGPGSISPERVKLPGAMPACRSGVIASSLSHPRLNLSSFTLRTRPGCTLFRLSSSHISDQPARN